MRHGNLGVLVGFLLGAVVAAGIAQGALRSAYNDAAHAERERALAASVRTDALRVADHWRALHEQETPGGE